VHTPRLAPRSTCWRPACSELPLLLLPLLLLLLQPAQAPPRVYMLKFKEQADRDVLFWCAGGR
jgi:hypothetical protein